LKDSAMAHAPLRELLSRSAPGSAVPVPLSPLLGRDEAATLRQVLCRSNVRLITLSGRGGVGKTSLALRIAHAVQHAFADGVVLISLAPISDPTLIAPTIAQTLSLPASPHRFWLDSLEQGTEWALVQKKE
jgi:Cdc6-like AAA superfamily ATPase